MEYITKVFIRGESKPINKTGATGATGSRRNHTTNLENNLAGWWLGHPSAKYEFVNWDD